MEQDIDNQLQGNNIGEYTGGNTIKNYIVLYQDKDREFIVTHNVNIKPVSYFTGREVELNKLCQMVEEGHKAVLVSGMGELEKEIFVKNCLRNIQIRI